MITNWLIHERDRRADCALFISIKAHTIHCPCDWDLGLLLLLPHGPLEPVKNLVPFRVHGDNDICDRTIKNNVPHHKLIIIWAFC